MQKVRNTYILVFIAAIILVFGYFPNAVEQIYSRNIYPIIANILRLISGIFPFAIGDLLYGGLIAVLLYQLFKFVLKRAKTKANYKNFSIGIINTILLIYIAFNLLWGLNYARPRINETLQISNQAYSKAQLIALHEYLLAQIKASEYNALSATNENFSIDKLEQVAAQTLAKLAEENKLFAYRFKSVKPTLSTWLTSKMGIEGYYNPLSGEANVNMAMPNHVLPYVTCHEIAHQLGFAKEDEANFVGYLTALNSDDKQFKYAAYYSMLKYVLFEIRIVYPEAYENALEKVPETIKMHFSDERNYWKKYNGKMSDYMSAAFDQLLKFNRQQKGIKSYQEIVLWLVNYHKKELKVIGYKL